MKLSKIIILIAIIILALILLTLFKCPAPSDIKKVDCSKDSLADIVENSSSGTRIIVEGNCQEDKAVVVTQDNIIIDGKGTAVIDGKGENRPVLTIKGAEGVIINGLTVKNGKQGIVTGLGTKIILKDVIVTENSNNGIVISKTGKIPNPDQGNTDIKQSDSKEISFPLSLDSFKISFIEEAVASSPACTCADTVLSEEGGSLQCTAGLEDTNMVVCGKVSSIGNGEVGMYTLTSSLTVNGNLELTRNGLGFHTDESSINVLGGGLILANDNAGTGVYIYESSMDILGGLTTSGNGGRGLDIVESDVKCNGIPLDPDEIAEEGTHCG